MNFAQCHEISCLFYLKASLKDIFGKTMRFILTTTCGHLIICIKNLKFRSPLNMRLFQINICKFRTFYSSFDWSYSLRVSWNLNWFISQLEGVFGALGGWIWWKIDKLPPKRPKLTNFPLKYKHLKMTLKVKYLWSMMQIIKCP